MTNKEKEKLLTQTIKKLSKVQKWKFKSYFIFKQIDNLFFEANFYINPKTDNIHGYLAYKPYSIDNTFWRMTEMPENSEMPLSFRADAAFSQSKMRESRCIRRRVGCVLTHFSQRNVMVITGDRKEHHRLPHATNLRQPEYIAVKGHRALETLDP